MRVFTAQTTAVIVISIALLGAASGVCNAAPQARFQTYKNNSGVASADFFHLEAGRDIFLAQSKLVNVATTSPDKTITYFDTENGINAPTINLTPATNQNLIGPGVKMRVAADMNSSVNGGGLYLAGSPTSYFAMTRAGMPPLVLDTRYVAAAIDIVPNGPNSVTVSVTNNYGEDLTLTSLVIQRDNTGNINDPGTFVPDGETVFSQSSLFLPWNSDPTQTGVFSYTFSVPYPNLPVSIFFDAAAASNLSDLYNEGGAALVPEPSSLVMMLIAAIGGGLLVAHRRAGDLVRCART